MTKLNIRISRLLIAASFLSLGASIPCLAGPALKAAAEANNEQYRQIKDLGLNPSSKDVATVNQRVFGPVKQMVVDERAGNRKALNEAIRKKYPKTEKKPGAKDKEKAPSAGQDLAAKGKPAA